MKPCSLLHPRRSAGFLLRKPVKQFENYRSYKWQNINLSIWKQLWLTMILGSWLFSPRWPEIFQFLYSINTLGLYKVLYLKMQWLWGYKLMFKTESKGRRGICFSFWPFEIWKCIPSGDCSCLTKSNARNTNKAFKLAF